MDILRHTALPSLAFCVSLCGAAFAGDPVGVFPGRSNNVALGGYTVSVQAVELCGAGSTAANCVSGFTLGAGTRAFDIASATVGAEVGAYADAGGLPVGATFTHVRIALSPRFTLTAAAAGNTGDSGGGADAGTCYTKAANGNTDPALLGAGSAVAGSEGQVMVVPFPADDTGPVGAPTTAQYAAINISRPSATPNTMHYIAQLTAPYTVGRIEPLIEVRFDTVGAMAALNAGGGNCEFLYPLPPQATIIVTSP